MLDLLDIDCLRLAAKDTDAAYKTLVWNLSQNVDRTTGSVKPGICPCLTPTMVPFVTNRGGPLIGLEALSLQVTAATACTAPSSSLCKRGLLDGSLDVVADGLRGSVLRQGIPVDDLMLTRQTEDQLADLAGMPSRSF